MGAIDLRKQGQLSAFLGRVKWSLCEVVLRRDIQETLLGVASLAKRRYSTAACHKPSRYSECAPYIIEPREDTFKNSRYNLGLAIEREVVQKKPLPDRADGPHTDDSSADKCFGGDSISLEINSEVVEK